MHDLPPNSRQAKKRTKLAELDAQFKDRILSEINLSLDRLQFSAVMALLRKTRFAQYERRARLSKDDLKDFTNSLHRNLVAIERVLRKLPGELDGLIEEKFESYWLYRNVLPLDPNEFERLAEVIDMLRNSPTLFEDTFLQPARKRGEKDNQIVRDFILCAADIFSSCGLRPTISFEDSQPREGHFKKFLVALWEHCWETPERWSGDFQAEAPCKISTMLRTAHSEAMPEFRKRKKMQQNTSADKKRAKKSAQ